MRESIFLCYTDEQRWSRAIALFPGVTIRRFQRRPRLTFYKVPSGQSIRETSAHTDWAAKMTEQASTAVRSSVLSTASPDRDGRQPPLDKGRSSARLPALPWSSA